MLVNNTHFILFGTNLFDGNDLFFVKILDFFFEVKVERVAAEGKRDRQRDGDGEVVSVVAGSKDFFANLKRRTIKFHVPIITMSATILAVTLYFQLGTLL